MLREGVLEGMLSLALKQPMYKCLIDGIRLIAILFLGPLLPFNKEYEFT